MRLKEKTKTGLAEDLSIWTRNASGSICMQLVDLPTTLRFSVLLQKFEKLSVRSRLGESLRDARDFDYDDDKLITDVGFLPQASYILLVYLCIS